MISDVLSDAKHHIREYLDEPDTSYPEPAFRAKADFVLSVMDALRLQPGLDTPPSAFAEKWESELFIGKVRLALAKLEGQLINQ